MVIADIQTLARFLTNTDSISFTDANLLILENNSYERIVGKLIKETVGGDWPFGDDNYSSFPTYTQDLVDSQSDYEIDALTLPLNILAVEILNVDGNFELMRPISLKEIHRRGIAQTEYHKTDGKPVQYEKRENIVVLYPAPDNGVSVTLTAGLKIFFLRTADNFTSAQVATGTKVPGFPSPWHDILAYEPAYHYALSNGLSNVNFLKAELDRKEQELMDFVSSRNQDNRKIIRPKPISFR